MHLQASQILPLKGSLVAPFSLGTHLLVPHLHIVGWCVQIFKCLCHQRQNHSLFELRDHPFYFFPWRTFWWLAYEQWNGLIFLLFGLLDVVVLEWRFFGFPLLNNLFL